MTRLTSRGRTFAAWTGTAAAFLIVGLVGGIAERPMPTAPADHPARITALTPTSAPPMTAPRRAAKPAPTTAAGYRRMFATLDPHQWGAADVSISQRLPDGRRVWLYGDTLSTGNGFVHSTAITQTGGRLHVSARGAQLLPDGPVTGDRKVVYWIEAVALHPNGDLAVTAAPISVGTASAWDFHRVDEESRTARVRVDAAGDARFIAWTGYVPAPPATNDLTEVGPHHFTYGAFTHDVRLASGRLLRTVNQNWDDPIANHTTRAGGIRYADFRPLFSSVAR